MMGDNKSEKFFKVLNDRMKIAQLDVKATTSVNVGDMTHKAKDEKEVESGEKEKHRNKVLWKSLKLFCEIGLVWFVYDNVK